MRSAVGHEQAPEGGRITYSSKIYISKLKNPEHPPIGKTLALAIWLLAGCLAKGTYSIHADIRLGGSKGRAWQV